MDGSCLLNHSVKDKHHIYCLETKLHNCNSTLIRWYLVDLIWSVGYNTDKDRHAYAARDYSCSRVCVCVCVFTQVVTFYAPLCL